MSARSPLRKPRAVGCKCSVGLHARREEIDAELRVLGTAQVADGQTLSSVALRFGVPQSILSVHRRKHLGCDPLPVGRTPTSATPLLAAEVRDRRGQHDPPPVVEPPKPPPPPRTSEEVRAQLVKTVATLIALGSYRGLQTVRALAARHSVPDEEVLRAHRRASASVRDGRGGMREQLELSLGVLTQIRDQERNVAEDYTGIAARIVAPALPNPQTGAPPQRVASLDELERAKLARSVAAQAQDCAIAAQKQIDQNTIHRRTAPMIQVSFSASPDFTRAADAWIDLVEALVGDAVDDLRGRVERGLAVFEDSGERPDAPEWLEYLAEVRRDREAVRVEPDAAE